MKVSPALLALILFHNHAMSVGVCVMANAGNLPGNLRSGPASSDKEFMICDLLSDVEIGAGCANGRQLVA